MAAAAGGAAGGPLLVYVGGYTQVLPFVQGQGEGVYAVRLDTASGEMSLVSGPHGKGAVDNPTYLVRSAAGKVYAASEVYTEGVESKVVAFNETDKSTGALALAGEVSSGGDGACHVTLSPSGKYVLVANYTSGHVSAIRLTDDGFGDRTAHIDQGVGFTFPGAAAHRQDQAHAHMVLFSPLNPALVFAADLGCDTIFVYRFDDDAGSLTEVSRAAAHTAGAGPRHVAFHSELPYAYVVNELDSTAEVHKYDPETGALDAAIAVAKTIPEGVGAGGDAETTCAAIRIHPNNKYLYCSNRGHDSVGILRIDDGGASLTPIKNVSTGGEAPRDFNLARGGTWMIAANQNTHSLVSFKVVDDGADFEPTGHVLEVKSPSAVCPAE